MLELSILGFLFERSMHAYELRQRISGLSGHIRPVSDGALYPALNRLRAAGLLTKDDDGARQVYTLTDAGRAELLRRLRNPAQVEITDRNNFFILLAFLRFLPDPADQAAVLRRRLAFYEEPASYFYEQGRPLKAAEMPDRFRRGMLTLAAATANADKEWLRAEIADLEQQVSDAR
ncbi:PadR family transcriptional regulator [Nocardia sp. CDC160]|uniref:PadR family transcriptional regulator n=1 Tax=Nocardia sp. CDC160 TaxID=3112166 RepID=UPI002DBD3C03|nr:PadR family transcriptional regulator [Nocardia sp. CDC160]MEC3918405.1 PadR family transcriptional regulator [Nocardia sp. CDC160]MEC3919142.1 PadR family transcriptional regulator [Nocardia sp. CDC160]